MSNIHHIVVPAQLQQQIRQAVEAGVTAAINRMDNTRLLGLMKEGLKQPEVAMRKAA